MPFNRDRQSFTVTCGDCGDECQIPFKPRDDRPVYCRECFQDHKPEERGGGSRFNRGPSRGRNDRGSSYGRNDRSSRFSRGSRDDGPRETFTVTCGDCGDECQIPFKPRDDRPVYCRECFQDHKPEERGGGSRFNRGPSRGRNDRGSSYGRNDRSSRFSRGSRDDGPRETFTVTCGDCGDECQIPFKPRDDRPVYCRECFQDHKPEERGGGSRFNRGPSRGRNDRGSSYGRNDRERPSFTVTCGDCGNECQVPFKPRDGRPVYCNDCFQDHK